MYTVIYGKRDPICVHIDCSDYEIDAELKRRNMDKERVIFVFKGIHNSIISKGELTNEVVRLLRTDGRLSAIKYYRANSDMDLRESKAIVDSIALQHDIVFD